MFPIKPLYKLSNYDRIFIDGSKIDKLNIFSKKYKMTPHSKPKDLLSSMVWKSKS